MEGVSLVETEVLNKLISRIDELEKKVIDALADLKDAKKRFLIVKEVSEITGFSKAWVNDNKADIGFATVGGGLRFRRDDVEEYMARYYFKNGKKKSCFPPGI